MTQKDDILSIAEDVGRVLAQIISHKKIQDYQGAHSLIDDLFKQTLGAGSGFIHTISEETLLAMLTSCAILNVEKALTIATLLKAEGDIYEEQGNLDAAYAGYLKSLNLFLQIVLRDDNLHNLRLSQEVEDYSHSMMGKKRNCRTHRRGRGTGWSGIPAPQTGALSCRSQVACFR